MQKTEVNFSRVLTGSLWGKSLEEILRERANCLVKMAVMAEFEVFIEKWSALKDRSGKP